jgi:hypothetical protein
MEIKARLNTPGQDGSIMTTRGRPKGSNKVIPNTENDRLLRQFADGLFADTLHIRMKLITYEKRKLPPETPKHIVKTVKDFIAAGQRMQDALRLLGAVVKRHTA